MASAMASNFRQEIGRNEPDFVTVVSVGSDQRASLNLENFITVLSIGTAEKNRTENDKSSAIVNSSDVHPEEQVEVFRLPGEPLGFGLKFEGGAKNAERVKRLFVQSCAEQSPASRAKCSWGTIGEGDEVLSIDGIPVTHMSRLDCVRRLKESQLVIKLLVRCRGALRPEVVSAERKSTLENVEKGEKKIPPELPSAPPPVPPRKLRHARGSGDGEANPIPVKKSWSESPVSSGSSSQTDSPRIKPNVQIVGVARNGKTNIEESPKAKSSRGSPKDPSKRSPNERSPEFVKSKQEPPEAMVYLDARSQDGSSTHGSTSDDTGSSVSTIVDRFSTSDRLSAVSTISTTSGDATDQINCSDRPTDENFDEDLDSRDAPRLPSTFDHLEQDFIANPSEFLLKRLANSEAVTHVESRGEAGGLVEKITAVVAPNTIIIEETLTLQPPLSFQDAPLSYGHETRPGLVYTADLAADSTTHFRPIRDEASIVERVNGGATSSYQNCGSLDSPGPPTLPARNHVNRIPVNQQNDPTAELEVDGKTHHSREVPMPRESIDRVAPILPPKPLPRKDLKLKRKRPPPPPPPPPRKEPPPPVPVRTQMEATNTNAASKIQEAPGADSSKDRQATILDDAAPLTNGQLKEILEISDNDDTSTNRSDDCDFSPLDSPSKSDDASRTNKVLEIIEMKKNKAMEEPKRQTSASRISRSDDGPPTIASPVKNEMLIVPAPREKRKVLEKKTENGSFIDIQDSEESSSSDVWQEAKERQDSCENDSERTKNDDFEDVLKDSRDDEDDDDETYRSMDEIKEESKSPETNGTLSGSEEDYEDERGSGNDEVPEDSTSDDSEDNGDDYYWQSNLATIGEEEETSSLEYTTANKDVNNSEEKSSGLGLKTETTRGCTSEISETTNNAANGDVTKFECVRRMSKETTSALDKKPETQANGKMANCEGDQRLPPDGDEFPATYQEFNACTSDQYKYVGPSTRLTRRISSSNVKSSPENLVGTEIDESSSTSLTSTSSSRKSTKNSLEKSGNDTIKSLRIESTRIKNSSVNNNNVIGKEIGENSCYIETTTKTKKSAIGNNTGSHYATSSVKEETISSSGSSERGILIDDAKRTFSHSNGSMKTSKNPEIPMIVTEKIFEISSYYPKDGRSANFEKIGKPGEANVAYESTKETTKRNEPIDPDYPDTPPPPLPLTGPPKIEATFSSIGKSVEKPLEMTSNRKYSLSSDLRRQDDKSEKSVRDKIAMFSSQSSLESPLFPAQTSGSTSSIGVTSNARKLSKYKSSDDVFNDEKMEDKKMEYGGIERTQSFVDLTDCGKFSFDDQTVNDSYQRPPSLPKTLPPDETTLTQTGSVGKTIPISPEINEKPIFRRTIGGTPSDPLSSSFEFNDPTIKATGTSLKNYNNSRTIGHDGIFVETEKKSVFPTETSFNDSRTAQTSLIRATSFSGESTFLNDISQSRNTTTSSNGQISRTNSLASTFRRNSEDMRRQSLNQLIEQRRKGISKLRGLVIPEKNAVSVDKPIIDLPEIKSRDSILLHQLPKATIQDKWGSQSSIASNASTASLPIKSSFKMPAPQIMSKYSPAFKRKSLAVYGSAVSNSPSSIQRSSPTNAYSPMTIEPPKSLESIGSPTRSDYSFEFVSSSSVSPEATSNGSRPGHRKIRTDYDDSDNDSAVSSSQSSMSRGFSPPTSPVPSERSSLSSERSYHTSLIMDIPGTNYSSKETSIRGERTQHLARANVTYNDRAYSNSERSSSGSSSCSTPNPRSPLPEMSPRSSQIPQRQLLKRSSSTETNCSSGSSSTLTSGSQASGESLSRRVLKPQSVEAINRKNILASARCRSGRDLNGSPLIQRKFSDDEELPMSRLAQENNGRSSLRSNSVDRKNVKIAYIEVTENYVEDHEKKLRQEDGNGRILEKGIVGFTQNTTGSDLIEASNDLKMWVRSEAKNLMAEIPRGISERGKNELPSSELPKARRGSSVGLEETDSSGFRWNKSVEGKGSSEVFDITASSRVKDPSNPKETIVETINEDLLTTLTTKSRSRAPINLEDRSYGRSSRQMSLEDILIGKKPEETFSPSPPEPVIRKNNDAPILQSIKFPTSALPRTKNGRSSLGETAWTPEDNKSFVSKIPMLGKIIRTSEPERSRISKIPTQRSLGRRSVSVTDMKKALDKTDSNADSSMLPNSSQNQSVAHHRFPSLDSSVEEKTRSNINETEPERSNGEQFGSISSLASSTSLISQQELAQLVEDASSLEDSRGNHELIVVLLHKENPHGSVGITLAGGVDCETKEITVHRVLGHSIADKDGRVQRGDRILSINGRSTRGLSHRESLTVLKQPRSEIVLVISRPRFEEASRLRTRTESVETIVEGSELCQNFDDTAWGPTTRVTIFKEGAGLGFSLAGGRDSPLGDRPLVIKKIFTGGAAEKSASLKAGDQLIEVNGSDVTRMTRIEAWSLMKKLSDGEAYLLVRHPATKSS